MEESKRIFINHLDTFTGYNLGKYLRKCIIGSSLDDDEEEEEVMGEIEGFIPKKDWDNCYEVHGTLKNKTSTKPQFAQSILKYDTREEFFEHLMEFDVIVYDISEDINQIDEALWVANKLHENFQYLDKEIAFVLLSSIMTWAKTKPADPEDTEAVFTEEDVKRRKPHPNFKEHFNAEKEILKLSKKHKSKIKMYVIASGILYGNEEFLFHDFFKKSWLNSDFIYYYGSGSNTLPTIHVTDLAGVIQNIADSKPRVNYILAVDDSKNTLQEIAKAVTDTLSNGKVKMITKEQALVDEIIQNHELEILLVDLKFDGTVIKDEMKIKWVSETGLVENIELIVKQYVDTRNLSPIKCCILGPTGSGKTFYAELIAKEYQLKHLIIKEVIQNYLNELDQKIEYPAKLAEEIDAEKAKLAENGEEEEIDRNEEIEEAETNAAAATEIKERLIKNLEENNGKLYDEDLAQIYKETLTKKDCLNHGFILDGFPNTKEQASLLFAPDDEEGEEENPKFPRYNPLICPIDIFIISASNQFLIDRFSLLNRRSDESIEQFNVEVEEFKSRLEAYRANNDELEKNDEDTILTYFDLRELYPIKLELKEDLTKEFDFNRKETLDNIFYELGPPRIYPPSDDEMVLIRIKEEELQKKQAVIEKENKKIKEAEMLTIRKHNQNEWNENLELVKKEMHEYYQAQSLPLRNYLMHLVMPVLTEGLMDCAKVRSDDPIDFLSEFIFQNNYEKSKDDTVSTVA